MQLDWLTFALEIVNFLVLVWLLQRFLYKPVLQTIARRKAAIEKTLGEATAKRAEADALEGRYRDRLSEWEREKEKLRAAAIRETDAERARRLAALEHALDQERERRRVVEERQSSELKRRLQDEASIEGAQFAARLLERAASRELEARLVQIALEDLDKLPRDRLETVRAACRDAACKIKVTSAFPLSEPQRRAIVEGLRDAAGEDVSAEFGEDGSLVAGLRIGVGPWILRANVRDELGFFSDAGRAG